MRICVYTVLLGGYDALLAQEVAQRSDADFICFTDDSTLHSETWDLEVVEPYFPQDIHRSSRVYKILGHERLADYDVTICIDASVLLRATPEEIVAAWLEDGVDMAVAQHSFREVVLDEFDEVVRLNYDDRSRVYEQLTDYAVEYPDVLESQPHWGGFLVRRQTPAVHRAMRLWFDHVLRYSRRDQLSLMVALLHGGLRYRSLALDNFSSDFHEWPVIASRKISLGKAPALPSGPLIADLRRARLRIDELEKTVEELSPERFSRAEVRIAELTDQIAQGTEERRRLEERLTWTQREMWRRDLELERLKGVRGSAAHLRRAIADRLRSMRHTSEG